MKRYFLLLATLCFSFLHAEPTPPQLYKNRKNGHFYIGPRVANLRLNVRHSSDLAIPSYNQDTNFDGPVAGAIAALEYRKFRSLYVGAYGSYLAGTIRKHGFPSRFVTDMEVEGRLGYSYRGLQTWRLIVTPYVGFGYNYIVQKHHTSPPIRFRYRTLYLPVGFVADYNLKRWFTIGFHFKWMPQLHATVQITNMGSSFHLNKKYTQYLVEVPFIFRFGCKRVWDIALIPYWERKKNGESHPSQRGVPLGLPDQSYTYAGGTITLGYSF